MKTVWEIYNNIEKDFKKRLASSPEAVDAINELNDEELKRFRSRVFDHYLSLPENQLVLEEEINIPSKPIYGFGGAKVDTPAVYRPAKTRRVEFSEIEPFVLGQKPQGFLSRVGDDLSNVGKAWKAGNFYSKGGWNDIAQNIINGGTPEEREVLFKNYLDWESKNQMPENKSWVGDVVNGVANLVPLTVDMLPEAATVGAATAAGGAALGSVVPGAGTVAGALGGLKLGVGSSMAEQSYKVGIADIYTSLRKDGVDDETAKNWAIWAGIPYGALEFMGKGVAPIQRKFLGGKVLKELIDKVSDAKIKNKILNAAAKYGADIALTGTLESATEGGQGGITEVARQGAKGEGYDAGKVASATWDEAAQAAPAMFGMAALGVPLEAATNFRKKRLQKDLENVQNAYEEGRKVVEVPAGVKNGEVFTGSDGKAYKNVDGIAQPYVVKIKPEVSDTDNLDADAESDPYGKPAEKPVVRMGEDGRLYAQTRNVSEQLNADFSPENAAKYYQPFNARGEMLDAPIRTMVEDRIYAAEKAEAQKQAQQQQVMIEAQAELEMGRQKLQKKLDEINRKKNRVSAIAKKIAKIDNPDDRLQAMEFYIDVENGDASKLTEEQLYEASSHGFEWADAELSRRAQTENSGVPLLEIMRKDGIKLPTPQAIQRHADANGRGLGSYLYGEIRDLYYSLPKNLQLKYFTKDFVDLDTVAADMEQTHGIRYDSEGDFLADVAANLSGQKVSYGAFSLAEKDYAKMTDAELVEAHRKAETAKDYSAGFEIKKEWDKRRGYNTDVYHGTGADGFNVAKADASEAKNGEGAQAHGMGLYASGNKEVAKAYRGTAVYGKPYYSYWAKGEELSKGAKELGIRDVYFNDAMSKIADVGFARMKKDLEKEINSYAKEIEELDRRIAHWKEKARWSRTKYYDYMSRVESYSYDARKKEEYKQEAEGKLKLYQLVNDWLASKGISEKELEKRARSDGKLYNWRTNLTKENTLDEQLPFSKQSREVQEKIKNAIESLTEEQLGGVSKEDALRDFIENNTDGGNIYDAFENYTGSKKNASKHLLKHGIRGITYDGKRDGRCYVSFEGGSAVKLQNAFTYDDNGKYIPLDKRSDAGNPDMRYSIGETDAQRFKNELQDYIDGKLDNRHVFKLGTTPEVMRLVGADDLPVELSASVLERKEAKHSLILENLSNLPEELADPIAVMQSSTIPDAITLITELPTIDRHNMLVAVHLNKRFGKAEINSIRSIYPKTQSGLQTAIDRGELRYINTKRKPSWITLPFQHASGRKAIQRAYGHEVFTQADLSQAEKENIFKLRGEDKRHSYSISEKERAKQAKIDGIKAAVEDVRAKFNRRAKVKASVDIVGTLEEAREKLGAESIPYNARAVQDKERVVIIAENIDNADEAVRIFLHELVGHWGVKKLFGTKSDLKPFLNYIITHYKDSNAWKRVAKYYKDVTKNKYAIAEEVLAHVAENRELSDPSMWKRLVHRVKRELWGNGVPQEYVNLLNEDVLRSAIALSREWAKGDHYLNANGIWAKIDSTPKGRDVPDDEKQGRFSLNERPTDAEIAEARRQKDEVKAKWINPDGSMKKGYMKAPNGKPTNLSEDQWLQVRTPNFKKWFGDWEKEAWAKAAMDFLEKTAPVANLTGHEFQKDGVRLTDKVSAYFNSLGNIAHNEELGDVILDLKSVEDSIAHGVGRLKSAAFIAVPKVIEKGFIFNRENNWKERGWDTAVIVAPVRLGGDDYICEVVAKKVRGKQRFYLHEVEIKKTLDGVFKSVANNGNASQVSRLIIGKHIAEVKGNVSKVVDENGEPLVVYHNTPNKFTIFKPSERGRFGRGIYATSNPEDTSYSKKWNMMALFANARKLRNPMEKVPVEFLRKLQKQAEEYLLENPPELFVGKKEAMLDFYFGKNRNEIFQHSFGSFYWNNLRDILDQVNKVFGSDFNIEADGFIIERDGGKWFNFFDRSQIKSATDNIGSFSTNNPDIRYSIKEDDERASNKKEWDNTTFSRQVDSYAKGNYPSGKFFTVGTPSALLKSFGIPDNKIVMTEGVLKKIKAHGLSDIQIKQIPEAINSPVGIFSYPKNENVFDVLVEMYMDDGRPIIVSLEINKTRQGLGEITDLLTAHPKENFGRIVNWAKKGRCKYWNKQKGRKLLQDTIPADWERYETELTPYLPLQSEVNGESQGKYSLKEETPENDKEYRQKRAREEIKSKAGRAVQAAVDAFAPLATLERVLYGDVRGAEKSAWKMALMTRNLDQVMFHVLRVGGIKYNKADGSFVKREGTKGLEEILKPVKGENYKNFEHYAKAKSAIERWGFLRKTNFFAGTDFYKTFGFSLEDAKKWVAEGSEASKKAFGELQIFFQGQRDFMLETGLISPEQHAALSRFKNYVPFFREGADLDAETEAAYERFSEIFPAGKGFSGRNSGVEKFEGSARRTKNLVENIVNQSRKVMDSGYKNIAAYRSLNLMRELDMAKYVRSDSVDAQVKIAEMRRALEAEGIEVGDISDEELLKKVPVEAYLKITDDSNDNIVSVRVNGTLRFYKVEDPELLVAVKNFGAEKVNVMWKLLTAPKNIMTQAITKTPEFAIRNFIRDTGSNTILFGGKVLAPYLAHTVKNAVKSAWNTADMQKVWAAGAGGGAWYSVKAEDIAADFKDGGKIQKIGKYTIKPLKWLLNEYERRILMPSEQGNRISVMQKALENGASDMEAAFQYLDVMNFGMHGSGVWTGKNEWAKGTFTALHAVVRITPFLNARIQGLYKLWRESGAQGAKFKAGEEFALKERTRAFVQSLSKAVLLRGMMMASASMLYSLYANSSTDDDGDKWFEKLPAHDKLNYWHFYLGNNNILRIPKPFEIGYIFGTIPEAITDALIQKRPQTAKVLWEGLTSQLEFDPLSNPVIDTVREQYWNKDSFTKRPIVQQSDKDLKPRYQYDPDTSATAKAVARVFEGVGLDDSWLASPARIQNVIGNFLGGMTKYITAASDVIVEALTDIEGGTSRYARESATKRVYDWAVRNTKTMTTRNAEDYYELRNRVREIYGAVRVLRQEKRLEECQNLIDEHKGELGNYNLIEAVNTRLSEISRKRKALGADRILSTEELIRADDELLAERNQLLADVDILIDRVEKGDFNARDMRDILKRIRNADREKRDSKKARARLRELANMR